MKLELQITVGDPRMLKTNEYFMCTAFNAFK